MRPPWRTMREKEQLREHFRSFCKKTTKLLIPNPLYIWGSMSSSPFRKPSLQNTRSLLPFVWLSIWGGNFLFRLKSQVPETLATTLYTRTRLCMRNHILYFKKPSLQNTRPPLPSLWLSIWGGNFSFRIKIQVCETLHCILRRIEFLKKINEAVELCKGIFHLS